MVFQKPLVEFVRINKEDILVASPGPGDITCSGIDMGQDAFCMMMGNATDFTG